MRAKKQSGQEPEPGLGPWPWLWRSRLWASPVMGVLPGAGQGLAQVTRLPQLPLPLVPALGAGVGEGRLQ